MFTQHFTRALVLCVIAAALLIRHVSTKSVDSARYFKCHAAVDINDCPQYRGSAIASRERVKRQLERSKTQLNPSDQFLGYFPYGGLGNQYYAFEHAAYIASRLDRVLILPPIMRNKHVLNGSYQRWSDYFDLPRFTELTGLPIVEWIDAKAMTPELVNIGLEKFDLGENASYPEWDARAEDITVQIIRGFRSFHGVDLALADMFLLRPTFVEPPPPPPQSFISSLFETAHNSFSALLSPISSSLSSSSSDYSRPFSSNSPHAPDNPNEVALISDILRRYMDSAEQTIYLSHTFSVMWSGSIDTWEDIGQHIHFTEAVNNFVAKVIRATLWGQDGDDSSPIRVDDDKAIGDKIPYIAVHLRRDDIGLKCRNQTYRVPEDCTPPLWRYVAAVDLAKEELKRMSEGKGDDAESAVIVTTDTTSEQDLEDVRALGWNLIDHVKLRTNEVLGMFGEVMVDSAILANAEVFVGTRVSTMSWIAEARQRSWHGHKTFYP